MYIEPQKRRYDELYNLKYEFINMEDEKKKLIDEGGEKKSFLSRWSDKKSLSKESLSKVDDNTENIETQTQELEEEKLSDEELSKKYEIENPENLNNPLDLKEILKKNIPDRLKQLALRKLWKVVPIYGEVSELVEYGEDFTDAATVVKNLQSAYVVGKGYIDKVIEKTDETFEKADKIINKKIKKNKSRQKKRFDSSQNPSKNNEFKNDSKQIETNKKNPSEQNIQLTQNKRNNKDAESKKIEIEEKIIDDQNEVVKNIRPAKMVFRKQV